MKGIVIVSGGQTGADRAALDFAIENGLPHGGWCPRDRVAEDGPIDPRYQLQESTSRKYAQRTRWNVRDSDATVVFSIVREVSGGTAFTIELAQRIGKPCLHLAEETVLTTGQDPAELLLAFLAEHQVERLNVAGPRASQEPGVAAFVRRVLSAALDAGRD